MTLSTVRVACSIKDAEVNERLTSVIRSEGVELIHLPHAVLTAERDGWPVWWALVYDLAPWESEVVHVIRRVSNLQRFVPTLLYVPNTPNAMRLLDDCVAAHPVLVQLHGNDADEQARLRVEVRELLSRMPGVAVANLVQSILNNPGGRVELFIRTVASELVVHGGYHRPTVSSVARTMSSTVRTVEHMLHELMLPTPKELLSWIVLLYVVWSAKCASKPVNVVGQQFGFPSGAVQRLRCRLQSIQPTCLVNCEDVTADQQFSCDAVAFALRCGRTREVAWRYLEAMAS